MYKLYNAEEERIKDEWNDMCKLFEQRLLKSQETLSNKFFQLFKERSLIDSDDVKTHCKSFIIIQIVLFFCLENSGRYS